MNDAIMSLVIYFPALVISMIGTIKNWPFLVAACMFAAWMAGRGFS
ncbi:hypothetical protein [Pseudomonas chlororaphis]|nr:hypothetical protein [Pseudomonas chlororaphis]MBP5060223.1 hypothetical protein [Pseudomonas chlororaphis]MBP5143768.1 hypothetical protein [Pseudomonas chlororaphis]